VTALQDRAEALALQLHDASVAAAQLADARDQAKPDVPCATGGAALTSGEPAAEPRGNDEHIQ
jgi:hypothetical protein